MMIIRSKARNCWRKSSQTCILLLMLYAFALTIQKQQSMARQESYCCHAVVELYQLQAVPSIAELQRVFIRHCIYDMLMITTHIDLRRWQRPWHDLLVATSQLAKASKVQCVLRCLHGRSETNAAWYISQYSRLVMFHVTKWQVGISQHTDTNSCVMCTKSATSCTTAVQQQALASFRHTASFLLQATISLLCTGGMSCIPGTWQVFNAYTMSVLSCVNSKVLLLYMLQKLSLASCTTHIMRLLPYL